MRVCPFRGCDILIYPERFCCKRHWYCLSREERMRIWACWEDWRAGKISTKELRERQHAVLGPRSYAHRGGA